MEMTLEQLAAVLQESIKEGVGSALAVKPEPAVATLAQPELSDRVVQEIDSLFKQDGFRTALATAIQGADLAQDAPEGDTEAEMGRGFGIAGSLNSLDNLGGFGIPLGSGFVGLFLGFTGTKIVDSFAPAKDATGKVNWINPGVKLAAAWASMQFLPKFLGRPASLFMAGYFVFDALRVVLPVDDWATKIAAKFPKPGTTVAQHQYVRTNSYALPSAPTGQVLAGYGGAGDDQLRNVIG